MFETTIGGLEETAWKEAKVRGGCLLPQISAPRPLSLCRSLSTDIGSPYFLCIPVVCFAICHVFVFQILLTQNV